MADKENAGTAAGPRLTRAAAKRAAAAVAAESPGDAKRRRVALGELPALANNAAAGLRAPSRPAKPSKPASRSGRHARPGASEARGPAVAAAAAEAELCASSSPPRAAEADAESNSASYSAPRATADTDSSFSSSPPRAAAAAAAAPADLQFCGSYASDIYTYLRSLEVLRSASLAFPRIRRICICIGARLI
jgi:cyclin A